MGAKTSVLLAALVLTVACEKVVGDFEAQGCDPSPPATCVDLGDAEDQQMGCCDESGVVWFCNDGALEHIDCGALTCDYDPEAGIMACVE